MHSLAGCRPCWEQCVEGVKIQHDEKTYSSHHCSRSPEPWRHRQRSAPQPSILSPTRRTRSSTSSGWPTRVSLLDALAEFSATRHEHVHRLHDHDEQRQSVVRHPDSLVRVQHQPECDERQQHSRRREFFGRWPRSEPAHPSTTTSTSASLLRTTALVAGREGTSTAGVLIRSRSG